MNPPLTSEQFSNVLYTMGYMENKIKKYKKLIDEQSKTIAKLENELAALTVKKIEFP